MSTTAGWVRPDGTKPKERKHPVEVPTGFPVTRVPESTALARPGKNRRQESIESEVFLDALSLTSRKRSKPAAVVWDETQSYQWRILNGTCEERADFYDHRPKLPIVHVTQIEDKPLVFCERGGNVLGTSEQADKLQGAIDRHAYGKKHKAKSIRRAHRAWLQGINTDDDLFRIIAEHSLFYLRYKWPRLGDDVADVVQRSVSDIFDHLKESKGKAALTKGFIEEVARNDAKDSLKAAYREYEQPLQAETGEDRYSGEQIEPTDPADTRYKLPLSQRELRVLEHLKHLTSRLDDKHRTVIEMLLNDESHEDIGKFLGYSSRYVRMLEQQAHKMLQEVVR